VHQQRNKRAPRPPIAAVAQQAASGAAMDRSPAAPKLPREEMQIRQYKKKLVLTHAFFHLSASRAPLT